MPPRPVPEDALVDDAPGGATAASIAELEKRLTAQAEALEKRLAEQFEAATAALLARLAPPVLSPPPKGTQPAIPAGAPAPEGGEQGAQEPLPAELDALDTELEYVDFAYFGQAPPSGLEPPPRDGDEPRLWILTDDDTELEKRLAAHAIALEKRLAEQFEAATAALLARLAPPVQSPPPKGTQPAIPAGAPAPEGGEQGAQEPLPAELDALDTELEYVDFAYFGQVPPSGLEPPPRDGDEPRLWILTDDTAARGLAEQRGLTAYDNPEDNNPLTHLIRRRVSNLRGIKDILDVVDDMDPKQDEAVNGPAKTDGGASTEQTSRQVWPQGKDPDLEEHPDAYKGAWTWPEHRDVAVLEREVATLLNKKYDGFSLRGAAYFAKKNLFENHGITVSHDHMRAKLAEADEIGQAMPPERHGGVYLPFTLDMRISELVRWLRRRKLPVFREGVKGWATSLIKGTPIAASFRNGQATEGWYRSFLKRQGLTTGVERPLETTRA
eukprot:jgi/Tetstr1/442143/TSEL_030296.t1